MKKASMLKISHLDFGYQGDGKRTVFNNFTGRIGTGEFVSLFGPNGSGKTTLLNLLAGVIKPSNGEILFSGKSINEAKIAYVFQDYRGSLFPWLTVKKNILFPLEISGVTGVDRLKKIKQLQKVFDIKISLDKYPYELSGGQQQIVSILRGLAIDPDILLLDEPFSSLDYQTSQFLLNELQKIWLRTKVTTVFVSHDIDESIFLSQKIILLGNKLHGSSKTYLNKLPYPRSIDIYTNQYAINLKRKILNTFSKGGEYLN